MSKPLAAKNTYAVARPNTLIKLINYATKTVGQGIAVAPTTPSFTFDEALALVALRIQMPNNDSPVYRAGTTFETADAAHKVNGGLPYFTSVYINSEGGNSNTLDLSSAVLRGILHPSEVTGN